MTAEPGSASLADNLAVSRDLPCVNCGYNLRTLSTTGKCPECGALVESSLKYGANHSLCYSNLSWLKTLHFALRLLLWISLLDLLHAVASFFIWFAALKGSPLLLADPWLDLSWLNASAVAFGGVALWAVFLFTRAHPRSSLFSTENQSRYLLRIAVLITFILGMGWQVIFSLGILPTWLPQSANLFFPVLLMPLFLLFLILGYLGFFDEYPMWAILLLYLPEIVGITLWALLLLYSRRIMLRIPHPRLARSASIVLWGMLGSLVIFLAGVILFTKEFFQLVNFLSGRIYTPFMPGEKPPYLFITSLIGLAALGIVVFTVWFFLLLFRLSCSLGQAAKQAAQNFTASGPQ